MRRLTAELLAEDLLFSLLVVAKTGLSREAAAAEVGSSAGPRSYRSPAGQRSVEALACSTTSVRKEKKATRVRLLPRGCLMSDTLLLARKRTGPHTTVLAQT